MRNRSLKIQVAQIIILVTGYWLPWPASYNSQGRLVTVCFAEVISSQELIENAKRYDGKIVTYQGEVVGDIMVRGQFAWVNVRDGGCAIGVWAPKDLVQDLTYAGSYRNRGDWVEVTGVFNSSCRIHGGDLDIHAQRIIKTQKGLERIELINVQKKNLAAILLGVAICLVILPLLKKRR